MKKNRVLVRGTEERGCAHLDEPKLTLGLIKDDCHERREKAPGPAEHTWIDAKEFELMQVAMRQPGVKLYERPEFYAKRVKLAAMKQRLADLVAAGKVM